MLSKQETITHLEKNPFLQGLHLTPPETSWYSPFLQGSHKTLPGFSW